MKTLIGYEIKKILMKKSTIVSFLILFGIQIFVAFLGSLGSTYVDDVFVETHRERNQTDRENGIALSGRLLDEKMLSEFRDAYAKVEMDDKTYLLSETYQTEVRKYSDLAERFKVWGLGTEASFDNITEETLYELRVKQQTSMWDYYELSDKEQQYWLEKENELEIPFTYEYATAYEYLISMSGGYMSSMLLTFFIAISMVGVFVEEHSRKTDQMILCSKLGRGKVYFAKILAGSIVVFVSSLLFALVAVLGNFFSYGYEGFGAMIQIVEAIWYSYSLSVGEVLFIMLGLLLLSSVMTAIFAMVLAEILKNRVAAMAAITGGLFAARLVVVPPSWGVLSQVWNYIPINLLKVDQGFTDLRLVSIFGLQWTTWQFAPILYLIIIVIIVFAGNKIYNNYQVDGR